MPMSAGEAKVGQRVRTLIAFNSYPDVSVGSLATIIQVVTQFPGAETDAVLIHPGSWQPDDLAMPCQAWDLELVEAE